MSVILTLLFVNHVIVEDGTREVVGSILVKKVSVDTIVLALRRIVKRKSNVDPNVQQLLLQAIPQPTPQPTPPLPLTPPLPPFPFQQILAGCAIFLEDQWN